MFALVPRPALVLGFAGLVPFWGAAAGVWLLPSAWAGWLLYLMVAYGAAVASFLGAVHWGLAMANLERERIRPEDPGRINDGGEGGARPLGPVRQMVVSVGPALIAWASLVFQSAPFALIAQFFLFGAIYLIDHHIVRQDLAPRWYLDLRLPLTLLVLAAYAVAGTPSTTTSPSRIRITNEPC